MWIYEFLNAAEAEPKGFAFWLLYMIVAGIILTIVYLSDR